MGALVFTCPTANLKVQHWWDDERDVADDQYEAMTCPACARLHFVNRKTGQLLGDNDE